jgi:protein-tyrosine-phosphatase
MAAALLRQLLTQKGSAADWNVTSSGTWAEPDLPATALAIETLRPKGIDLNAHRSRMVDAEMLDAASIVLVMTRNHLEALHTEFPKMSAKFYLLSQLIDQTFDIEDPFGGTADDYRRCAIDLEQILIDGFDRLVELADRANNNRSIS